MKKFLGPFVVIAALFFSLSSAHAATDLSESHGFYEEMTYLMEQEIVGGYPDGTVRPEAVVTRAEAAIMIGRLKGLDGTPKETPFTDVSKGQKASGFIAEARETGLISGYPDGLFRPYEPITRGDMAIILANCFDLAFTFNSDFTDVSPNMRAYGAIGKILAANITAGYDDYSFRPSEHVTRGQFSAFLARGLEPKFKNDARIAHSYMKDKTKTYTYRLGSGDAEVHSYQNVPNRDGLVYGFMWFVDAEQPEGDYEYAEVETHQKFFFGYPYSEYDTVLAYPVGMGATFKSGLLEETGQTITGVNKTIQTEYRTFNNATEITIDNGYKYYMVEGFSTVKSLNDKGEAVFELIDVK